MRGLFYPLPNDVHPSRWTAVTKLFLLLVYYSNPNIYQSLLYTHALLVTFRGQLRSLSYMSFGTLVSSKNTFWVGEVDLDKNITICQLNLIFSFWPHFVCSYIPAISPFWTNFFVFDYAILGYRNIFVNSFKTFFLYPSFGIYLWSVWSNQRIHWSDLSQKKKKKALTMNYGQLSLKRTMNNS